MIRNLDDTGCERLVTAIVWRAVADYHQAQKRLKKKFKDPNRQRANDDIAKYHIRELERFFRSGHYQTLTEVDGEEVLARLTQAKG